MLHIWQWFTINYLALEQVCAELVKLDPNERICMYDRILFRLRQTDKDLAKALELHWSDHLKPIN